MNRPTNTPEDVTTIAKQTAKRLKPLDLREVQGELYRVQRAVRVVNRAAVQRKSLKLRHRARVRLPLLPECKVLDTRKDSRGRLYFELDNGQAIRADKAAGILRKKNTQFPRAEQPKIQNPVIRKLVVSEVERNALRAAA
jgi:hypothetical protein